MGLEAIKLELIEWLTKLEDEDTIEYLRVVKDSKTEKDFEKYIELQPNWENVKAINEITERYKRAGEILSVEFSESKERLEHKWSYVFASRKSFVSWNREIFFGGRFNRMKIPSTYKHQIIEQFIS